LLSTGETFTFLCYFACLTWWSDRNIKLKVKLSLCLNKHHVMMMYLLLMKHHAMKYWGSGGIASHILNRGCRWRWVVSFTLRPLYLRGKSPRHPLDKLGGVLDPVWTLLPLPGIGPQSCNP